MKFTNFSKSHPLSSTSLFPWERASPDFYREIRMGKEIPGSIQTSAIMIIFPKSLKDQEAENHE
jgi:hypothetical protein